MIDVAEATASFRLLMLGIAVGVLSVHIAGCAETRKASGEEKEMAPRTIQKVLEEHSDQWMSIPGVVGTGIGKFEGKACIRILAVEKTDQLTRQIPSEVEGFPVIITETGEIRALE